MLAWLRNICVKCQIYQFSAENKASLELIRMKPSAFALVFIAGMVVVMIASYIPTFKGIFHDSLPIASKLNRHAREPIGTTLSVRKSSELQKDFSTEAHAAMKLAREMIQVGKFEKANKLYQHAFALDPQHPDVLNEYGEFLENHEQDIVKAEHMYTRALTVSPSHTKALANRKRTLPLVEEIDLNRLNIIDSKRDTLIQIPESHPGLRRMKKESYYWHIYHTTAIEGNTFTLSQTRAVVETRMAIAGKSIMEHNEILGLDAALSFVNSSLLHKIGDITLKDILDIHKRVLGFVDPMEAGQFRTSQVFVGDFIPPLATELHERMQEFIQWLNSEETLSLHPIEHAALAHYKLVTIHPFYDGNGRTARLLMNLILMQAGFPPIIIKVDEKHEYYQHIEMGNKGDIRPFIRFIAHCTERTLDEYLWVTSERPNVTRPELTGFQDDGRTIILEEESKSSIPGG